MSKFKVGDRVRHTNGETPEEGVIVFFDGVDDDSYLVEFEGWEVGHGVKRNQWYCNEEDILPVETDKTETLVSVSSTQIQRDTLTIRDQFAMAALTGMIASEGDLVDEGCAFYTPANAAERAYFFADAMLEARKVKA